MTFFIVIIIPIICTIIVTKILNNKKDKNQQNKQVEQEDKASEVLQGKTYRAKDMVLTPTEQLFYVKLKEAFPQYNIQTQQVLYSFIKQEHSWGQTPRGLFKSVDFLLCNANFKPMIAIELNDKTHDKPDRIKRDEFVTEVFKMCNIPLVVFHVEEEITPDVIVERINNVLNNK